MTDGCGSMILPRFTDIRASLPRGPDLPSSALPGSPMACPTQRSPKGWGSTARADPGWFGAGGCKGAAHTRGLYGDLGVWDCAWWVRRCNAAQMRPERTGLMTCIMAWPFYGSGVTAVLINTCEHSQMLTECSDCCWRQCLAVPKPGMANSGLGAVLEGSLPLLDWP